MGECLERYVELARQVGAPFTMDVVKSIAALCNENPYELWYNIALLYLDKTVEKIEKPSIQTAPPHTPVANCWRCSACNRTFNDIKHLVNHITYFVRQKDKAHMELYQKIKKLSDEQRKSFTEIATNILKC